MIDKKTLLSLKNQLFKDVILFDMENPAGRIIGRDVRINIDAKNQVVIVDDSGNEILRKPPSALTLYYHQGWGGINIVCRAQESDFTLTLHYVKHVKS